MKTSLALIAVATLGLWACESTTPAQRATRRPSRWSHKLTATSYPQLNKPRSPPRSTSKPKPTRAAQQAQAAAIMAQGFQNAADNIANSARQQQPYYVPYQPVNSPVFQPVQIDTAFHPAPLIPVTRY